MNTLIGTAHIFIASLAWFVFGCGAAYAVFSPKVKDTTAERIALCAVSMFAFGTSYRVYTQDWVSEGGMWFAVALASYVCIIIYKHERGIKYPLPKDKAPRLEPTWRPDANL